MKSKTAGPRKDIFDPSSDFLNHTLENAATTANIHTAPPRTAQLADGTSIILHNVGCLEFIPAPNKNLIMPTKLILSAGIHGNETAPIELCNTLINEIFDGHISIKTPTLFIFGNPQAISAEKRFIEHNLNRLFCGTHNRVPFKDSVEGDRAAIIEHYVDLFIKKNGNQLVNHYDLHTAIRDSEFEKFAISPFIQGRSTNASQLQFLAFSDIEAFIFQTTHGTTFSSHTAERYNAESFTVELGKVQSFGENDESKYRAITENLRLRLQGGWPSPRKAEHRIQCFISSHEIINTGKGFTLHIPDDVSNFTPYPKGHLIWQDNEQSYRVKDEFEYIVFPNSNVEAGQRAGIMLRKVDMSGISQQPPKQPH